MSWFGRTFSMKPSVDKSGQNRTPEEIERLKAAGMYIEPPKKPGEIPQPTPAPPPTTPTIPAALSAAERQRKRAAGGSLLLGGKGAGNAPAAKLAPRTLIGS